MEASAAPLPLLEPADKRHFGDSIVGVWLAYLSGISWAIWFGGSIMLIVAVGLTFGGGFHDDRNNAARQATAMFMAFRWIELVGALVLIPSTVALAKYAGPGARRALWLLALFLLVTTLAYVFYMVPAIAGLNLTIDFNNRPISAQPGGSLHDLLHQASTLQQTLKMFAMMAWGFIATVVSLDRRTKD